MQVIHQDAHDVSPPLDELLRMAVPQLGERAHEAEPVRPIPHLRGQSPSPVTDPVVQSSLGPPLIPATGANCEGAGTGLPGVTVNVAPPDTDGDVGPNHYVQIVNSIVTIFNKSCGIVRAPFATNTLFAGFSGQCATTNDGDGVVRYDHFADRWVIAQFSVNGGNGPFFQCIAVSTTGDPTGTYNRYQFSFNSFNDYPKMGMSRTAYYFTYNLFSTTAFLGAQACALDRATLIAGAAATQICFTTSNQFGGLLPGDDDTPLSVVRPPPPEPWWPFFSLGTSALEHFDFHVDFTTPSNSTFTGPTAIPVAAFTPLCNGGTCVVQPGTTNRLDSLADRLMNRLAYRHFGDHDAVLVTHAVTAGSGGGVRFYEIRNLTTGTPALFQQGTFAPDSAFRWMSSAAFDGSGNVGMGYTISSSAINPSVRYTGRLVSDALGTMGQGEGTIVAGTGSQTGNLTRWGDYSSMNIDPSDDCTFWYTQEYMGASGSFNWRTRIGSFRFPSCGAAPANDFSVSVSPASRTVNAGSSVTYTVTTAVTAGSAQTVNLSVSGLPAGVTGSFSPASVTAGGSSTLTLTAAANAAATTATFTVTGTGTPTTHSASAQVTVAGAAGCINGTFSSTDVPKSIPDNNATGITSVLPVTGNGTVGSLSLSLNITHTFIGDLVVTLIAPDGTSFIVSNRAGGSTDNLVITSQTIPAFNGHTAAGTWQLKVQDLAGVDVGTLDAWSLTIFGNCGGACVNGTFNSVDVPKSIPDVDATGISSNLSVTGSGTVASLALSLNITHTFIGDLVVTLVAPDGTSFIVSNRAGGSTDNLVITNQAITAFTGHTAAGIWKLMVQDLAAIDVGTLDSWSLAIVGSCP